MNYNVVTGMDNPTLNKLIGQFYGALYPAIFRNTLSVGQMGIDSVTFDFTSAPQARLASSLEAESYFRGEIDKMRRGGNLQLEEAHLESLIGAAAAAAFMVDAPAVQLTINYQGGTAPTTIAGSLTGIANATSSTSGGSNYLTAQIVNASVSLPGDPALEALLNSAVIPYFLVPYLNNTLLGPIRIPALQLGSLQLSMPVPAVQSPNVLAFSALGGTQPDVPAPGNWPGNCVFLGTDQSALQAAAALPFPLGPQTGFSWSIIDGSVGAQVSAPQNFSINSDGSISAVIQAAAWAQLTVHTPWPLPDFSFGPRASATIAGTLVPSVRNGELYVQLQGFPIPYFDFSWGSIPDWVRYLLYPLLAGLNAALNAILGPIISKAFSLPPIPVYQLPKVSVSLGGKDFYISLTDATTAAGGPSNNLLLVKAQMQISDQKQLIAGMTIPDKVAEPELA
ncbi:hypothetical protein [Flaviaesturariibacter terrae]